MATTLTYIIPLKAVTDDSLGSIKGLSDLIMQRSMYLADHIGAQGTEVMEKIPITNDDYDFVFQNVFTGATEIFTRLSAYSRELAAGVEGYEEEYTFTTAAAENVQPAVVLRFVLKTEQDSRFINYPLRRALEAALVRFVLAEWLKLKGIDQWQVEHIEFEKYLSDARHRLMMGETATIKHRTF